MHKTKTSWMLFACLLGGMVFALGCVRTDAGERIRSQSRTGLVADNHTVVAEVPMPIGFRLVEDRSREWDANGFHYTEYLFQGKSTLTETVVFYRQQLPTYGWTKAGERADGSVVLIQAGKPGTGLGVQVSQRGNVTSVWVQKKRVIR